jgi:hypothetical protein
MEHPKAQANLHDGFFTTAIAHGVTAKGYRTVTRLTTKVEWAWQSVPAPVARSFLRRFRFAIPSSLRHKWLEILQDARSQSIPCSRDETSI